MRIIDYPVKILQFLYILFFIEIFWLSFLFNVLGGIDNHKFLFDFLHFDEFTDDFEYSLSLPENCLLILILLELISYKL